MIGVQLLLSVLATFSAYACEMPRMAAWPLAMIAMVHGLRLAKHESAKQPRQLVWPADGEPPMLDGEALNETCLRWRGPLVFLRWRDVAGRCQRLSWWPDTLPPARRRELRLAAQPRPASRPGPSMAP